MTRKYRRMTVSFEVLMLAPESEDLDGYFVNYDNDEKPVHESFTLADDEHEDVLADMSDRRMRDSTCRKYQEALREAVELGTNDSFFAFMAVLAERFFVTDITIHQPVAYEEKI